MIGAVLAIGRELLGEWRESRRQKREVKKAAAEFRQQQARSEGSHRQEWELRVLEGRDVWLQRAVLLLWLWPLIWAYVDPPAVQHYFNVTLKALPEWYKNGLFLMLSVVWGVAEFKQMRAGKNAN